MKKYFFAFLVVMGTIIETRASGSSGEEVVCRYNFMSAELFVVSFQRFADGSLSSTAQFQVPGSVSEATLTKAEPQAGELLHAILAEDDPAGAIELIIYAEAKPQGRSKLINPQSPLAKELWGDCTGY